MPTLKELKRGSSNDLTSFQTRLQWTPVAEWHSTGCWAHSLAVTVMDIIHIPADVNRVTCVSEEQVQGIYNRPEFLSARFQYSGNHYWQLQFIFAIQVGFLKFLENHGKHLKKYTLTYHKYWSGFVFFLFLLSFWRFSFCGTCWPIATVSTPETATPNRLSNQFGHVFWQESLLGQSQSRPFSFSSNNEKKKKKKSLPSEAVSIMQIHNSWV